MLDEHKRCFTCRYSKGCSILGALYCELDDIYVDENYGCEEWGDCYFL